jgi:hypothetical protein
VQTERNLTELAFEPRRDWFSRGLWVPDAGQVRVFQPERKRITKTKDSGPQMLEVSRDGKRIYFSNSLYGAWDAQFYAEGIKGRVVKVDALPDGSLKTDPDFFIPFQDERPHQIRLQGGDCSSDSFCFP